MVGAEGSGRHTLAAQMRSDPARPEMKTQTSVVILSTEMAAEIPPAHLTIVIVDAQSEDFSAEQILVKKWSEAGKNILVLINKIDLLEKAVLANSQLDWMSSKVVYGSANDSASIQREFVPAVLELLPQQHLALGRQFPLFRLPIAHQLINDTCFSNAAYSFSTGVAEIVPVLDIPLNVTDMIILTKSQAFLAYKLGLLFGFTTRWQDYVTEFGGVIGGGFIWRQIARQLIGLDTGMGNHPQSCHLLFGYLRGWERHPGMVPDRTPPDIQANEGSFCTSIWQGERICSKAGQKTAQIQAWQAEERQTASSCENTRAEPG